MNKGSFESLNVSTRCGCNANAFEIRAMAVWLISQCWARLRVDQCVASRGINSSVAVNTRSTWASVILRGTPGARLVEQSIEAAREKSAAPFPGDMHIMGDRRGGL